ncbi:MAG: hydantoinase/oxoprolinase family protein, partial [Minicystis sp.]
MTVRFLITTWVSLAVATAAVGCGGSDSTSSAATTGSGGGTTTTSNTVGAGAGSIARYDDDGALLVGPESAGSIPGPACYGAS